MTKPFLFHTAGMRSLDEQITWQEYQITKMKENIPEGVRTGKITLEVGHERIEWAESILRTLMKVRKGEVSHG